MLGYVLLPTFLAAFFVIISIYLLLTGGKTHILNRLETYTSKRELLALLDKDRVNQEVKQSFSVKNILSSASQIFKSRRISQRLETELFQADIPLKGEEYITIILLVTVGPPLVVMATTGNLLLSIIIAVLGYILSRLVVQRARARRIAKFNHQLGDALVMMANSLRAGFSFFQAVDLISRETPRPISQEFGRMLREMNLGISTEQSLANMCKRIVSEDLDMVVTAVMIQRQVGGNLAEVLDNISHTIRERVRIKGEIRTLTSQGRISGLIIGLLPLALLGTLTVINPSYSLLLFTTELGLILLAGGLVSQVIGMLLIRKVVNIRV